MAGRADEHAWEDEDHPRTPGSSIDTPIGAGSDVDLDDAPIPNLNVTMKMALSSEEVHRGSYSPNDGALSIGHFIGIAKRFLEVEESRISLVIGTEDFNANWNTSRIFLLKAVLLLDNNCNHCSI